MDAFSYLSVLLSIILGLAITQVLQGYRALLLARDRVRLYPPTLIWSALLLVMATQSWWASFGLAGHRDWSFASFGLLLLQTALLYMMAALVLPDMPDDRPIDLAVHYHRQRRPFFAVELGMLGASLAKDWMIDGRLPGADNLAFHALFGALALAAIVSPARWLHALIAPLSLGMVVVYIAVLFARL